MTAFLSETRERFLRAIAATIPPERLIEIYFFAPIRQGGIESGVAVIAATPELQSGGESSEASVEQCAASMPPQAAVSGSSAVVAVSAMLADSAQSGAEHDREAVPDETVGGLPEEITANDSGASDEVVVQQEIFVEPDAVGAAPGATRTLEAPPARPERYTVYTAKYRLALKGLDRGKWETAIVAEADAPLLTIETVVRGVQQRSGDTEEPDRMPGTEARGLIRA